MTSLLALGRRVEGSRSSFPLNYHTLHAFTLNSSRSPSTPTTMSHYSGMSLAELKVECRKYGIPIYGKKIELQQKLLGALVKRLNATLEELASGMPGEFYPSWTLPRLKSELKTRNLPVSGTKDTLIRRLRDADVKDWNSRPQSFPQFSKLPVEIREYIWEYSLPGPRLLVTSYNGRCVGPNGLWFRKGDHTPNPAALQVCQLSRRIALKRYRLVFATNNVYADLEGGDIFGISEFGSSCLTGPYNIWACEEPEQEPAATILADLKKVTHLLLPYSHDFYIYKTMRPGGLEFSINPDIYRDLAMFESLKTVSLGCDSHTEWSDDCPAGQKYIEYDVRRFMPMNPPDYWSFRHKEPMVTLKKLFYASPTEADLEKGIPKCQLVELRRRPISVSFQMYIVRIQLTTLSMVTPKSIGRAKPDFLPCFGDCHQLQAGKKTVYMANIIIIRDKCLCLPMYINDRCASSRQADNLAVLRPEEREGCSQLEYIHFLNHLFLSKHSQKRVSGFKFTKSCPRKIFFVIHSLAISRHQLFLPREPRNVFQKFYNEHSTTHVTADPRSKSSSRNNTKSNTLYHIS